MVNNQIQIAIWDEDTILQLQSIKWISRVLRNTDTEERGAGCSMLAEMTAHFSEPSYNPYKKRRMDVDGPSARNDFLTPVLFTIVFGNIICLGLLLKDM